MNPVGTENLPLFAMTHARRTDPATSQQAAESMVNIAAEQCRHVYDVLTSYGPATADEIDARIGWRPTTAGRRLPDLLKRGLVRRTGETRKTRSGRQADVYDRS